MDGAPRRTHEVNMATGHQSELKPLRETRFWSAYNSHRYAILFYMLLFTLVAMPVTFFFGWSATAIEVLLGATLLAAVMPMGKPKTRLIILAAILFLLAARPLTAEINEQELSDATLGLWAIIGLLAAAGAVRFVVEADEIYAEHVYAALGAYLMAGMFFGTTYWVIEAELPGSFGGPSEFTRQAAVYFSFVTLATLGYGDFLPKTDMARGLVVFEVMGGQLFLAVMIARLVGLYGGGRKSN